MEYQYYVLFPNHDNGLRLKRALQKKGVRAQIAPTPRAASKCCGISLIIPEEAVELTRACVEEEKIEILEIVKLEKDIHPERDRYC